MAGDIGAKIGIDGEKAFRDSLNAVNAQLKNLDSEMKAVVSSFADMEEGEAATAAKSKVLEKQIQSSSEKISLLSSQTERAKEKLYQLADELEAASREFGENSVEAIRAQNAYNRQVKTVNNLERQMNDATAEMNRMKAQMKNLENSSNSLAGELQNVADDAEEAGNSFRDAFLGGVVAGAVKALAGGIINLAESTKEYNKIMGTLEVSSQKAGYTAEQTKQTYTQLYGVLGDNQQAATAAANLQALKLSQEQLIQMTSGAIGAWATYGDSIPIDGLAESINETVKAGTVTGTFADVLNWAGTSEDAFNEKLAAASSESERANLVLQELSNQGLMQAAEAWQTNNSALYEANEATARMEEVTGRFGEMFLPIVTEAKNGIADMAEGFLDLVENGSPVIPLATGIATALAAMGLMTFVTQAGAVAAALGKLKTAVVAVNTAMKANPILLVVSLLAGLVAALVTAYQTNEDFRNKVNAAWAEVKEKVGGAVSRVVQFFKEDIPNAISSAKERLLEIPEDMKDVGRNIVEGLWNGIKEKFDWLKGKVGGFVDSVKSIFTGKSGFDTHSPSKWSEDVGENVDIGLANGLRENADVPVSAMEELTDGVIHAAGALDGAVSAAKKTARKVGDVLQSEIDKINRKIEAQQKQAAEEQAAEELKQYQDSLSEKYQELSKAEGENVNKIREEIAKLEADWNKKQVEAAKTAAQEANEARLQELQTFQQEYESALEAIESKQESLRDKLLDYGELFQRIDIKDEEGNVIGEKFQLGDLQKEIDQIQRFGDAIDQLNEKGISQGILAEISAMGMEDAMDYMNKLIRMSDSQFDRYVALFEEKQQAAQAAAEKFYRSEAEGIEQEFLSKLPAGLTSMNQQMYQAGQQAAQQLAEGLKSQGETMANVVDASISSAVAGAQADTGEQTFLTVTEGMTEQEPILFAYLTALKDRIVELTEGFYGDYVDIGLQMMQGISKGVRDGESGLINSIAKVIANAIAAAKAQLDIHSPSGVFEDMGIQSVKGYVKGWLKSAPEMMQTVSRGMQDVIQKPVYANTDNSRSYSYGDINFYVERIDNGSGRSAETLAREIEFIRRQQATGKGGKP